MQRKFIAPLAMAAVLAACGETPPPTEVDVHVTVEEQAPPEKVIETKDERGTIIGDGQRHTRP